MQIFGPLAVFAIGSSILFLISFLIRKASPDKLIVQLIPQMITGALSVVLFVQAYVAKGWDALGFMIFALFFIGITVISLIAFLIFHFTQKRAR